MGIPLRGHGFTPLSLSLSLSLNWRGRITFNNRTQEPHRVLVFYPLSEDGDEDVVVHAVEEFPYVAFEREGSPWRTEIGIAQHLFRAIDAPMGSIADATGERGRDERFLKDWIDDRKHGVMQNPVAHRRFMDVPLLRIVDIEAFVRAVTVRPVFEVAVQLENVLLEVPLKTSHVKFVPLVLLERVPRIEQVFRRYNVPEKVAINFHG